MNFLCLHELSPLKLYFRNKAGLFVATETNVHIKYNDLDFVITREQYELALQDEFAFYWQTIVDIDLDMRDFIIYFLQRFGSHSSLFECRCSP